MMFVYKGILCLVVGETTCFYICKAVEENEETIYVPKEEIE